MSPTPESFATKLSRLMDETSTPDWDGEGACPIPRTLWEEIGHFVLDLSALRSDVPKPHPSAAGDGSIHLRWLHGGKRFDAEFIHDAGLWICVFSNADVPAGGDAWLTNAQLRAAWLAWADSLGAKP